MGEDDKPPEETRTDANAPGYVLVPAARRAISSRSIESCADVSSPPASSDRAGGFGGFKKKGKKLPEPDSASRRKGSSAEAT